MKINSPCCITPRLLAGVKIGNGFISIDYADGCCTSDDRTRYRYWIDAPTFNHYGEDIESCAIGGSLQGRLSDLLYFLVAVAESYAYLHSNGRRVDNLHLFQDTITQWAYHHSDELSSLAYELDRPEGFIQE